ncbi:hypothetical protein SOCEGT47_049940 [Sorangium cellulosum]|uniref:Secreted protein n=1 Tax=Sorangium cellulosum TaxID=56 RepID=A0A4P2Q5U2_SORCE|nr:hypothetical protein [Sorangium cellulosum]AUX24456.1 hypothetical protein SOCEGT47_049940 [Sorangium cellulosum]
MIPCRTRTVALLAVPLLTAACIGAEVEEGSEELIQGDESAVLAGNGFLANALTPNALTPNALAPNALTPNALTPAALTPNALAAIQDPGPSGTLSRELVRYIVSCALSRDQVFSFSWTDGTGVVHAETFRGELGIVPWWIYGGISSDGFYQRLVTACLAARTNWYGVSVMVSLRYSENALGAGPAERSVYPLREGAFWGNLFGPTPYVRACHVPDNAARAREVLRDCAAGHVVSDPGAGVEAVQPCGAISLAGACDDVCNWQDSDTGFYRGCLENPASSPWIRTSEVITSFITAP